MERLPRPPAPFSRRNSLAFGLVVLLVAVVPAAAHQDGTVVRPAAGETLEAGSFYLVRWTAPAGADELELMLLLEDGRERELRLTEQLDPELGAFLWQVPELPAHSARLRLRWGIHGTEVPGPPGAPFHISSATRNAALELRWFAGEWWLTAAPGLAELPETSKHLDRDSGTAAIPHEVACFPRTGSPLDRAAVAASSTETISVASRPRRPPASGCRRLRSIPLRC